MRLLTLPTVPRPATFPECPHCRGRMLPEAKAALRYLRCEDCGHEQDHVVVTEAA